MTDTKEKFYRLSIQDRKNRLIDETGTAEDVVKRLSGDPGLSAEQADHMIENVIGTYALPVGIAQNFVINGNAVLVPMVIEEPSVVAAASFMAKLANSSGGFRTSSTPPEMIAQIQLLDLEDIPAAMKKLEDGKDRILEATADIDPILKKLGGGPRDLEIRHIEDSPIGAFLVLHLIYDVRDAMGANAVNTAAEKIAPMIEEMTGGRVLLRILSNLADRRLSRAECKVTPQALTTKTLDGNDVIERILEAYAFAAADPYRAATHNKGIMNGIDPVVIATGNDWRAVEAGAHAWAARGGRYTCLSHWEKDAEGNLTGTLELPMAVGIVGGATRVHPGAKAALEVMGVKTAAELAEIITAVGLAQNLAAMRALATEGIQRGHMALHAKQVAAAAGVEGEQINKLAAQLVQEKNIRIDRAEEILKLWKTNQ